MKNGQPSITDEKVEIESTNNSHRARVMSCDKLEHRQCAGDRNQCPSCAEFFNSTAAFDRHRIGKFGIDRRCLTVSEMQTKGMAANNGGFWITKPMPEKSIFSRAADANQAISHSCPSEDTTPAEKTAEIVRRCK